MNALHYKAASWVGKGVFDSLASFSEFESRVNDIFEEKNRGDVFEIFIEGYLATQAITQHAEHWVVGGIPVEMRERFKLPNDPKPPSQTWRTFLDNHVGGLVSIDFFVVPTATFAVLFV
ncbi:MAG: hypothetical protein MK186_12430, partial [Henriciella sp.]|nr:hypothetical protein [Henriciella sp.]